MDFFLRSAVTIPCHLDLQSKRHKKKETDWKKGRRTKSKDILVICYNLLS